MSIRSTVLKEGHTHDFLQELEVGDEKGRDLKEHSLPLSLVPASQLFPLATPSSSMDYAQSDCGKESLATYLASPIRTLCESVKDPEQDFISDHDIAEAYNLLCGRIRFRKNDISITKTPGSMCKDVPLLVLCISRDIHRVLPNPFESLSRRGEQTVNQSYDTDPINEENMPPAMDHMLCQSALRLMSDLFMYPTLYSMFSHGQISTLLQDALLLCMPTASWAFDIERLRCTVLLMLKTQQLPLNLLRPDLTSVLNALLCVTNVREATMTKIDGLGAICSLLQKYPTLLPQFVPFLPSILNDLKIDDLDVRLAAVQVLSGFALAKHNQLNRPLPASTFDQAAEAVHTHVTKEHAKSLPPDNLLPLVVKSAISHDSQLFWKKKGHSFAISLVSTLAVLLDYRIFTSPRSLKLVFSVIQLTAGSRWKHVAVHSEMWKILLWSFSRIPRSDEDLKDPMAQGQDVEGWNNTRERAYRLLKQEFREGIGVALVTILLHSEVGGQRNHEDVGKALEIVEDLVKSERQTERLDAVLLLEKLMSGIGVPLHGGEGERLYVRFSKELVDGSLVGKTFRDLTVHPTTAPIDDIQPLSETEVLSFWDKLSEFWCLSVQDLLLHFDGNLPHYVFEIWQALLLVQGQLTESHQHLTASPSFTYRVVSIVTQISLPLETPVAQARYLNTISELWTVMKNVFTKAWLPSPAERILASLLRKRFDLSDETVKIHWSQLCAELISVGIPTLMHVLYTKTLSPSQEEMEVTRRLWVVLATNAAEDKVVPEDHWMNLVQLLVMPIGAWKMGDWEVEIWRSTLSRTVEAAASVSQPAHVVISVLLDSLGESKLDLLKNQPTLLNNLLSHLTPPCTNSILKLLSIIDSVLQTSYLCIAERKTWALECLHLVAKLISQTVDSEIMQIITAMPNGLCKWIADEESVLTDFEHREVVVTIYGESLKRVSAIDPTLDRLRTLANFLHSAFVRVQNDGLLSFENFWRSTYHHFKGVSKKDYPFAIRACLKAWSDVCDDSFADDISLGSESQSLESYTVPDSQPSPEKRNDNANVPFDEIVLSPGQNVINGSDNESSQGTVTPKAKQILAFPPLAVLRSDSISDSSALLALQEYQSNITSEGYVSENSFPDGDPPGTKFDLKRQSDFDVPRTPKRRRKEPHFPNQSLGQPSSSKLSPFSEPLTRVPSPVPLASNSQPSAGQHSRKRRREETPSWLGSDLKRRKATMPSSDDYDTWEQNVLTGTSEIIEHPNEDLSDVDETTEPVSGDLLSPSIGQFPLRSRKRDRSQTAPEPSTAPDPESVSIPQAGQTLRRHQTSPLEGMQRKTSAQLDALQRAYAIITDTGTSQINVQDIMHARRLANQINQELDEQMCLKFGEQQTDDVS